MVKKFFPFFAGKHQAINRGLVQTFWALRPLKNKGKIPHFRRNSSSLFIFVCFLVSFTLLYFFVCACQKLIFYIDNCVSFDTTKHPPPSCFINKCIFYTLLIMTYLHLLLHHVLLLHYCHCCFLQFCIYEKLRSSKIDRDRIIIVVLHMQTSLHDDFSKLELFSEPHYILVT